MNIAIHDNPQRTGYPMYAQYETSVPITILMINCIVANGEGEAYFGDSVKLEVHYSLFYRPREDVQVHAKGRDYTSQEIESGALGDGCLSRDPLFASPVWGKTGDYRLKPDSPCIDAGSNIRAFLKRI